jgi:uncharacterized membrane protein
MWKLYCYLTVLLFLTFGSFLYTLQQVSDEKPYRDGFIVFVMCGFVTIIVAVGIWTKQKQLNKIKQ